MSTRGGGGGLYYADRSRNQLQVSLTKYAEKFGRHSLKFGAEIERSHVRSQYQPYGPAGFYIYAYGGVPYYRISYGYDVQGDNRRTSVYAQDQWTAGRADAQLGLRLDHIRGFSPVLDEDVYKPTHGLGAARGHRLRPDGQGHVARSRRSGAATSRARRARSSRRRRPGIQDYIRTANLRTAGCRTARSDHARHSSTASATTSSIRARTSSTCRSRTQLTRTLRLTATGIWRKTNDFVNNVIDESRSGGRSR